MDSSVRAGKPRLTPIDQLTSVPEIEPTRLAPMLVFATVQLLLLGMFVAAIGAAFGQALGMGGSGQGGSAFGALLLFGLILGVFLSAPAYIVSVSSHQRPVIRLVAGLVVYVLAGVVCTSILFNIREELWLATPMIATGAMLAVILPDAGVVWRFLRLFVPAAAGLLSIGAMVYLGETRDLSLDAWGFALAAAFGVGLTALWFIERYRT
jgi:hypothetical protein